MPLCWRPRRAQEQRPGGRAGWSAFIRSSPREPWPLPQRVHLLERGLVGCEPALARARRSMWWKRSRKRVTRGAQLALGVDHDVAGEVHDREQEVADLAPPAARAALVGVAAASSSFTSPAPRRPWPARPDASASRSRPRRPSPACDRRRSARGGRPASRRAASALVCSSCLISCHWRYAAFAVRDLASPKTCGWRRISLSAAARHSSRASAGLARPAVGQKIDEEQRGRPAPRRCRRLVAAADRVADLVPPPRSGRASALERLLAVPGAAVGAAQAAQHVPELEKARPAGIPGACGSRGGGVRR